MSENNREFSFSHNAIEILSVYDEKHGTEFLPTLYQYVANERNLVATAKVLFIHRNTLVYRIKRIMEIIGSDLESPEERAFIYFSMKMKFYEEK